MTINKAKAGDKKATIENQKKAIELARKEVSNPEFTGRVFHYTITEYEDHLKKYKKS